MKSEGNLILHFMDENCEEQNRAYWRTCSFIIGYILETAFKPDYHIELCSFPSPHFQYGSFVYDVKFNIGKNFHDEMFRFFINVLLHL